MNSLNEWFWALGTLWGQNKVPVLMWHMYQYRETVKSKIMGHVRCGKLQASLFCIKLNLSRTPEVGREQVHPEPLCFRMREKGVQRPCSWQVSSDLNSNLEASVFGTDWSEMSAVRRLKGVHDVAFLDQDWTFILTWFGSYWRVWTVTRALGLRVSLWVCISALSLTNWFLLYKKRLIYS